MIWIQFVFWAAVLLGCYAWFGYPMLLWVVSRLSARKEESSPRLPVDSLPSVTAIIAVHNEEAVLLERIENCLALSYPREKLEVIVASDGSTDGTVSIAEDAAKAHGNVRVYAQKDRVGKSVVQNAAARLSKSDFVLFSDADTSFDAHFLEHLMLPFGDQRVGCVTGMLVSTNPDESAIAGGTDYYWRYEYFLWHLESRLGLLAWGSGPCLAVRRELFRPMDAQYGEDCIVPLDVVSGGHRVAFQPAAVARETRIASPKEEMRARIRMTLRSFAGTLSRRHVLNPLRFPRIAWSIISHKLLRWLTPYFLLLAFASNVLLLRRPLYQATLAVQVVFYLGALVGHALDARRVRLPLISTIYAFCLMNAGVLVGVARALSGQQIYAYRSEGEP